MDADRPEGRGTSRRGFGYGLASAGLLTACGRSEADYRPTLERQPRLAAADEYSFAIHPLHNPHLLHRQYAPLMSYLEARLPGTRFRLVASPDYASFEQRLSAGQFHFALPNPYQTLRAIPLGYRVFAKEADDGQFRGLIVVRKDAGIRTPADLAGKTISYPARTAVAATLMVQYFLQTHGLPIASTRSLFVGSQESSISSVYLKASQAGGTWPSPWAPFVHDNPRIGEALEVKWRTDALVNNGLVAFRTVPDEVVGAVRASLVALSDGPAGRKLLERMSVAGFEAADEGAYRPVRTFLADYARTVGPIDGFG